MVSEAKGIRDGLCRAGTHMPDQAFMCDAKVLLLYRNDPMIFGEAAKVITEKNLYQAYQAGVQILEILDKDGHLVRVCTPRFGKTDATT